MQMARDTHHRNGRNRHRESTSTSSLLTLSSNAPCPLSQSPPYDTASTTVPSIPTDKLRALADDEDVKGVAPDARAKARSWAQVVKVVSTSLSSSSTFLSQLSASLPAKERVTDASFWYTTQLEGERRKIKTRAAAEGRA